MLKQYLIKNKEIIPIPIKEDIRISTGWIRLSENQLSPVAQEFLKILKSQC